MKKQLTKPQLFRFLFLKYAEMQGIINKDEQEIKYNKFKIENGIYSAKELGEGVLDILIEKLKTALKYQIA